MMEGLKEALQYITELKEEAMEPRVLEIDGMTYCDKDMKLYHHFPTASPLYVNTLSAMVDYIKGRPEELRDTSILHIESPVSATLKSGLIDERIREDLLKSNAIVNGFEFDRYYDQERFLIELQANFLETDDLKTIMKAAGNIKAGTTSNYSDDGVSQKTTIRSGVEMIDVIVPNPVSLRPYRTFLEVEQPESNYVFRIKETEEGPMFKLVDADGGLWRATAMKRIKEYLEYELHDILDSSNITILA